ncbi:sugar phosphate isomerase/epimerase [Gammaproteobacteria bacterium]|nr:sugar phosphate isomerase/epimerase [Gammaproteobacteria bacterium]
MYFKDRIGQKHIDLLKDNKISAIELAPFHQLGQYNVDKNIQKFKSLLDKNNFSISGIQAFTYLPGLDSADLFYKDFKKWGNHFTNVCKLANFFNTKSLVFGAPSLRKDIKLQASFLKNFFLTKDIADKFGLHLYLEAVPHKYDCMIFNNFLDMLPFLEENSFPIHFDLGCFMGERSFNNNELNQVPQPNHFHISSTNLSWMHDDLDLKNNFKKLKFKKGLDGFTVFESTVMSDDFVILNKEFAALSKMLI